VKRGHCAARQPGLGAAEVEEAWVVRALYREERLKQAEIGLLLGRHKSW